MNTNLISVDAAALSLDSSSPISPKSQSPNDSSTEDDATDSDSSAGFVRDCLIMEESEPAEGYDNGKYYPTCIGDLFAGTYRVVHKLGWGGYSTVWAAYDTKKERMVALKIGAPGDMAEQELKIYQEILATVQDPSLFLTLLDTFLLPGDKGTHRVIVLPIRGPSVAYYLISSLPTTTRMLAARQLLLAIKNLHDIDIINCGNGSIVWYIGDIDKHTPKTFYREFGRPQKMPLPGEYCKPGELVQPIEMPPEMRRARIFLADFGLAIKVGSPVEHNWQAPACFCAPERFHGSGPSFASDMWSYMCLFAYLYLGVMPLRGQGSAAAMESLATRLGPLPAAWADRYEGSHGGAAEATWYDQTSRPVELVTLESISRRSRPEIGEAERQLALRVLAKGFAYLPEERPTAGELLEDEDFNTLLAMYGA